jgi:cytochrome c oxidase cbb3-type subunit 2
VGGKYSNAWHVDHLSNPEAIVPESVMPKYAFLATTPLDPQFIADEMRTHRMVGVPYTDDDITNAKADFVAQDTPDGDASGLLGRYGAKVTVADFDGKLGVSEMDALVAYLQMLGTLVDFSTFTPDASR